MKQLNIIQFLPYFPPHKGGLETHAEEWGKYWKKEWYGDVYNFITHFNQDVSFGNIINFEWKEIWYIKDGVENLIIPSFEIISNFPIYKFRSSEYRRILRYLKTKKIDRVITRTRFFFTSFIGWLYAKKNKINWCHIEHGSDYVKLNSYIKNMTAYLYDKIFWISIFYFADLVIWVSDACKVFIQQKFINREMAVIHRWVELLDKKYKLKKWDIRTVFIGRLVKLKWVEDLILAIKKLSFDIKLDIIWDGDERKNLEKLAKNSWKNINFLWFQNKDFIIDYLYNNKCIFVNTSYQEWLPSSVIEGLYTWNIVVASNVWGTKEISDQEDLLLFEAWDIDWLIKRLTQAYNDYDMLVGKSYEYVRSEFSWGESIKKYYSIFL